MTLGLALPLAISCSSPCLSMGARQPVKAVFWATTVISFSPLEPGYRTVCFLHEACQLPHFSKHEMFDGVRLPCPRIDQQRAAQSRCNRRRTAIILDAAKMRLDDDSAVRLTSRDGQIIIEEKISHASRGFRR